MQINIYSKITKRNINHQPRGICGPDIARNEPHVPHSGPFLLPYKANLISRGRKEQSSRAPFRAAVRVGRARLVSQEYMRVNVTEYPARRYLEDIEG
jgi:hypothetical protein